MAEEHEELEPEPTEPGDTQSDAEPFGFDAEALDELGAEDLDNDDDEDDELEEDDDDEEEGHPEPEVTIEVSGLSLYTHMGVSDAERQLGQRLIVDVRLDIGESDATVTDRIEDTVDYGEVCETINLVAQQRNYKTLERFCAAVADRLIERYEIHAVWVKAAKPEPPIALPVSEVSVEVWREA
jgi:7,8-dihydroneopterin aldolase/epimerase/oxygenase